jgi:hypothetical protein
MDLCIVPECYVDTNLIETLVPPAGKGYNHQKGSGTVARTMQKGLANGFALGIIDKDKKELDYLNEFEEVVVEENHILHKHTSKPHYIIQIKPAIERFILEAASSVGISVTEFDLPVDLEKLKQISKTEQSKKDVRFKSLFKALKKALVPQILILAN